VPLAELAVDGGNVLEFFLRGGVEIDVVERLINDARKNGKLPLDLALAAAEQNVKPEKPLHDPQRSGCRSRAPARRAARAARAALDASRSRDRPATAQQHTDEVAQLRAEVTELRTDLNEARAALATAQTQIRALVGEIAAQRAERKGLRDEVLAALDEKFRDDFARLREELRALVIERLRCMYQRVWEPKCYERGQFVTLDGSLWAVVEDTGAADKPGQCSKFVLAVKRGRSRIAATAPHDEQPRIAGLAQIARSNGERPHG
jgi:hypothetical protein